MRIHPRHGKRRQALLGAWRKGASVPCDHTFAAVQTVEPSCTEQGYTLYACSQCGRSYTDDFTPAKGHTMREIVVEPTCTHQGYTTHFCTVCGYEYSDAYKEERGHKYVSEKIDPTCTQAGCTLHTCSVCGDSYRDDYREALGHAYAEETFAPTCTSEGYTKQTCARCGDEVTMDYVPALGHTYTQTTIASTCVSYGYTEHLCSVCGDWYVTGYIEAKGHTFLDVLVEATPESIGYTRHICIVCDYSYISDSVTSGDTGYIEPPEQDHAHAYAFYVQDVPEEKYFIARYVCDCGASAVGNVSVTAFCQRIRAGGLFPPFGKLYGANHGRSGGTSQRVFSDGGRGTARRLARGQAAGAARRDGTGRRGRQYGDDGPAAVHSHTTRRRRCRGMASYQKEEKERSKVKGGYKI